MKGTTTPRTAAVSDEARGVAGRGSLPRHDAQTTKAPSDTLLAVRVL